ncbi:MAG: hypothetical protein WCD31_08315 [Gillisia sp.]
MNSTLKNGSKKLGKLFALKAGKKIYRNGGIIGGAIAAIIAVGTLASEIQKKRKKLQQDSTPNKKIVI